MLSIVATAGAAALGMADHNPILFVVAGGFGFLAGLWTRRLTSPEPTLVLTDDGVRIRDRAFIPWPELMSLRVFRVQGRFLGFEVANPKTIALPSTWVHRAWRSLDRKVEGSPVSITENLVEGKLEDVVDVILSYKSIPVDWHG